MPDPGYGVWGSAEAGGQVWEAGLPSVTLAVGLLCGRLGSIHSRIGALAPGMSWAHLHGTSLHAGHLPLGALCDSMQAASCAHGATHTQPCRRKYLRRLCGGGRNPGAGSRAGSCRGSWGAGGPAQRAVPLQPALALSQEPHDCLHRTGPPTAGDCALPGMPLACCMGCRNW